MCGGSPDVPEAPAPPPRTPETPRTPATGESTSAVDRDRRRRAAAAGTGAGTIITGARGVTDNAATATKTLLGS